MRAGRFARVMLVSAASLFALLAASPTTANGVEPAFGNTVLSTYPDGRTAKLWIEPGGTYAGEGRRGGRSSGRWVVKGDQLCLRQSRPIPIPMTVCRAVPKGGVGMSWPSKAVTGEPVVMTLVRGQAGR